MRPHLLNRQQWQATGLSQLRMGRSLLDPLPPVRPMPRGYSLRAFRPGDEPAWLETLNTGDFGLWDRPRLDRMLAGEPAPVPLDGIVFATTSDNTPVGAALAAIYHGPQGPHTELGWVAVHQDHRARGLGFHVCREVLVFARSLGHSYAFLKTEDFRLAAIKTYLSLGFEPETLDDSHPERWACIRELLQMPIRPSG